MKRPWKLAYQKLFYFQKKIAIIKTARHLRNSQRLLHRNRLVQLLVVQEFDLFDRKIVSKKYLTFQIYSRLWVLSLWPICKQQNIKFLTGRKSSEIYKILCTIFNNSNFHYIFIGQFQNYFNQKTKYWILSNIFIEKKFFLTWLKLRALNYDHSYSLLKIFFLFIESHRVFLLLEYKNFYLIPLKNSSNSSSIVSLKTGFYFLGWFFKKESLFSREISHQNFQSHQNELRLLLKKSKNQPVDKVIDLLNKKICRWKNFYYPLEFSIMNKLNDYLFWLIWQWIQKRHPNRGSKWLYTRYWKKITAKKWIFFSNNETLIFY